MVTPVSLFDLGAGLAVDTDHILHKIQDGALLLINLKPQEYPAETHAGPETIIAFKGRFSLELPDAAIQVAEGESITVPPGIEHRFGSDSDALILVVFGA